ncbi:hypothetical protein QTI66_37145 [Variovorax sp. J22R133]|uniref:hypothetical protein n=1 Tax=Variovorax brevis TaxID=3053503 RepID=UPI00257808F9|nr:hypothetical protein [Variovorax sp. J22R133]MDM0117734.1 hypothetical protein [Variovorax sp. J22R133]
MRKTIRRHLGGLPRSSLRHGNQSSNIVASTGGFMTTNSLLLDVALLAAASMLAAAGARAQSGAHEGSWQATFKTERGAERDGTVVIKGDAGTWDMNSQNRNDPCVGRQYPIAIKKASADELEFVVMREATLAGCKDTTMRLKSTDGTTFTGLLNGRDFSMKKK